MSEEIEFRWSERQREWAQTVNQDAPKQVKPASALIDIDTVMNLSELIGVLKSIAEFHGDLPVVNAPNRFTVETVDGNTAIYAWRNVRGI